MTTGTLERVTALQRRRWTRRLRRWRPWLVGATLLGIAAFLGWVVLVSSWLGVRTVTVNGVVVTPQQQVTAKAAISPGTPLARVDLAAVQARVDDIPTVAAATVTRSWPHTVVIRITERKPVAAVSRDGGWWLMDATGVVYLAVPGRDPALPVVELAGSPTPSALRQVASVVGSLPQSLRVRTARVRAASMDAITLLMQDGREVRWGSAHQSGEKAAVAQVLLRTKARTIDVSVPTHPATSG